MGASPPDLTAFAGTNFKATLDHLVAEGCVGLAVSGGPDSLALLLLSAAARPGQVVAATVDHGLRPEGAAEAAQVGALCAQLGVPHEILTVEVPGGSSLQAQARKVRYEALGRWAEERGLPAVATAHHADDVAETLLMRLARGSGLGGLAGIRRSRPLTGNVRLVRPLLGWRKEELAALVATAGVDAADDPSNRSMRHDRTRARQLLASTDWLDPLRLCRSAAALEEAREALQWSAARLAAERVKQGPDGASVDAADLPPDFERRLLLAAMEALGAEEPDGPGTDRALDVLRAGGTCTLCGLKLSGGTPWRLTPEPPRRT